MKKIDIIVLAVFVIALVILFFLRKCQLDIWALLLGAAVALGFGGKLYFQHKRLKELRSYTDNK